MRALARNLLCSMGANEIQTFSFISEKDFDAIRLPKDAKERDTVKIINPMGEDTKAVRTTLVPAMLEVLSRNDSRSIENARAYEIGIVFNKREESEKLTGIHGEENLPKETYNLTVGSYGKGETFFTLKGMLESLFEGMGIEGIEYEAESQVPTYHPGRCGKIYKITPEGEKDYLGIMGEVHPEVQENYDMDVRCYVAELLFDKLTEYADKEIHYTKPPRYPSMTRDIAMIVSEDTTVSEIEKVINGVGVEILRDVVLFDVYRGEQVGEGKKSVAFSLTYRHEDRTLTDEETEEANGRIVASLKEELGAVIRDN